MTHSAVDPTTLQIVPGPALSACVTTEQTIIIEEYYGSQDGFFGRINHQLIEGSSMILVNHTIEKMKKDPLYQQLTWFFRDD